MHPMQMITCIYRIKKLRFHWYNYSKQVKDIDIYFIFEKIAEYKNVGDISFLMLNE